MIMTCMSTFALPVRLMDQMEKVYDTFYSRTLSRLPADTSVSVIQRLLQTIDTVLLRKRLDPQVHDMITYLEHLLCVTMTILNGTLCQDDYYEEGSYITKKIVDMDHVSLRSDMLREHNRRRDERGLTSLVMSDQLNTISQEYAEVLCKYNDLTHDFDSSVLDRYNDGGYHAVWYGENIAMGQVTIAELLDQFTISPPHRANMYNDHFTEIGIGYCDTLWVINYGGK